jgi:hypothetical protein
MTRPQRALVSSICRFYCGISVGFSLSVLSLGTYSHTDDNFRIADLHDKQHAAGGDRD